MLKIKGASEDRFKFDTASRAKQNALWTGF